MRLGELANVLHVGIHTVHSSERLIAPTIVVVGSGSCYGAVAPKELQD